MNDASRIKQLKVLAFVPVANVIEKFDELMSQQLFVEHEELLL